MAIVNIDDLAVGMRLSRDVCCRNGRLLFPAGTIVEERQLRVLRIWGVTEVAVAEPAGESATAAATAAAPVPGPDLEAIRAQVTRRFRLTDVSHPAMATLFGLCLKEAVEAGGVEAFALRLTEGADGQALPAVPASPEALIAGDPDLVCFSDIYLRLQEAVRDPGMSAGHIANIIGRDPGLAARLLQLANSPFYGLTRRVDSLARGVMIIGAGELTQLALGLAVVDRFKDMPACALGMRQCWEHAVGCGVLARVLASHVGGLPQERLFVAGLLHDLGRLVMLRRVPRHMARSMALAGQEGLSLVAAERQLLGFDHAAVGATLLGRWGLPEELALAVRGHHGGVEMVVDAAVVHVADVLTVAAGFGCNGSPLVPPLDPAAWDALGLAPSVVPVALSQARRQVGDIVDSLLSS